MSAPKVTVYSKDPCVQCTATLRWLDAREIPYQLIDITDDDEQRTVFFNSGLRSAPVVIVEGHAAWAGFDPAKLTATLAQT